LTHDPKIEGSIPAAADTGGEKLAKDIEISYKNNMWYPRFAR